MTHAARRPSLPRRTWLGGLLGGGALLLGGCGFELRRTPPLPFTRVALSGFTPASPLGRELRERLLAAPVQVIDNLGQAEVVLQALTDKREKSVVASTASGQVREVQLRLKFEFRISSPGGRELVPPTELLLSRDMSYSETNALAKAQEESELYAAMQTDIVQQVLRRMARLPGPGGAAASSPAR
jgi:LPS-assembly lipoprotein